MIVRRRLKLALCRYILHYVWADFVVISPTYKRCRRCGQLIIR